MRDADISLIRGLPLFRGMAAAEFGSLSNAALLQRFPAHVALVHEGDRPDFLHVLVDGAVELFGAWDGRETTIDVLHPITTFVLAAVVRDEPYLKSARTLGPSRILMIPAEAVRDVFGRDSMFARAIVNELAARYRSLARALKDQKLRSGIERLANWILVEERHQGGRGRVILEHDKRTLSSRLGMTPENLSRNLSGLSQYGVTSNVREIVVSDREALKRLAKPDPLIDSGS